MNILFETDLMDNQKHAVVMSPSLAFDVLQSQDGDSLFFSIGTDSKFYLTREVSATDTGWNQIDLGLPLWNAHPGSTVLAKTFSIDQNPQTNQIDLALVLTINNVDYLYLSQGNVNTDATWANGVSWTLIPFDAGTAPSPLTIADVYLMNVPADGGPIESIFVDILHSPGNALKLLDRYYITPGGAHQWNKHVISINLAAGSITSCLGNRADDPVPGIYTFGTISSEVELIFTPQYNYFAKNPATTPPESATLTLPSGASSIASSFNSAGVSNLFVAGTNGLYLYTPDNQLAGATPVQISTNSLLNGATQLAAATVASKTAVWGIDPQGNLFYLTCAAGSEANASAWSIPVPLVPKAEGFAFFLNLTQGYNVLFAHIDGENLVQLSQDPMTTSWHQRTIVLPTTAPDDIYEYKSFTTHIQVNDANGVASGNTAISITSTSPVSVYMNDIYYRLSPTVPVNVITDPTGVLTVVQETQTLAAVCLQAYLTATPSVTANIDPLTKAMATLGTLQSSDPNNTSGQKLAAVTVTNYDGSTQPLLPTGVSSDDRDAAATSLANFVQVNSTLPTNGSKQTPTLNAANSAAAQIDTSAWGLSFENGAITYHAGVHPQLAAAAALGSSSNIIVDAGDFFSWIGHELNVITGFTVKIENGINKFLATIGNAIYEVWLDCKNAVVHAVEYVFNKIKIFFEDFMKWLGSLLNWADIIRTHNVLSTIYNLYGAKCIANLDTAETDLKNTFADVISYIDGWAGIPDNIPANLAGSGQANTSSTASGNQPGGTDPQSNWCMHQLKSNMSSGSTDAAPNIDVLGDIETIMQPLLTALSTEEQVISDACDSFKSEIIDMIANNGDINITDLLKALTGIIVDALLESIETVLIAVIDVVKELVDGILLLLNATIQIPVISVLYRRFVGKDLSLMDLGCLLGAIPITIIYKLINDNEAPFPDDDTTNAILNATSFADLQQVYASTVAPAKASPAQMTLQSAAISSDSKLDKILVLSANIAGCVGALTQTFITTMKKTRPNKDNVFANKFATVVNGIAYFFYAAPDIMGQIPDLQKDKWWAITNEIITDLMVVKVLVDTRVNITPLNSPQQNAWNPKSPWIDCVGNILWQIPTTAASYDSENENLAGRLGFWGGTCFDLNGMMSPLIDKLPQGTEPETLVGLGIAGLLNLAYGGMAVASGVENYKS
ncbi:hypothetical protein MTO98_17725 [Mucilaginibacter sp. SMC90]|uniref:hypothetical protein n=1 Tax=Mucilaginibacter sp. SMC90 TaxID=2929803 RepID=UPI001FB20DE3|nr:hypothetical protein [Mucilaginibacter sp. SMC90]UOE46242.1 hypothetical protein MTO98_17725 [Mucilaginibacter sp. SMC90]